MKDLTARLNSPKEEKPGQGADPDLLKKGWKFRSSYLKSIEFHELQCHRRGLESEGYHVLIEPSIIHGCVSGDYVSIYSKKPRAGSKKTA